MIRRDSRSTWWSNDGRAAQLGMMPGERAEFRCRIDDAPMRPTTPRPASTTTSADSRAAAKARAAKPTAKPAAKPADKPDETPATPATPVRTKPRSFAPARTPRSGANDSARGATGNTTTPRATVTADRPVERAKPSPTPPTGTTTTLAALSSSSGSADQHERMARERARAEARSATNLDAAVPQADRAKLQAEQNAFFGTTTPAPGSSLSTKVADAVASGALGGGTTTTDEPGQGIEKPRQIPRPIPPVQTPAIERSHEEQLEFFENRDHWIAPDGDVWLVEITDEDQILIRRDNDPDGIVNAGYPPARQQSSLAGSTGINGGGGSVGDSSRDAASDKEGVDESSAASCTCGTGLAACSLHGHGHDHAHWVAPTEREHLQGAVERIDEASVVIDAGGKGGTRGEQPESTSATGFVVMQPDGQAVTSRTLDARYASGATIQSIDRRSSGPEPDHFGRESIRINEASRPDGSSVRVLDRTSIGRYADRDSQSTEGLVAVKEIDTVTIRGANGSVHSTSTDRPSPRETPTTMDELRTLQDELGATYDATPNLPDDASMADQIFQSATTTRGSIDRAEIQRAVLAGARHLAGEDSDLITQFGDETFGDVRDRFEAFGLDAADGNELIDRDWFDERVTNNAYYSPGSDKMVFGVMEDGTPLAMSDDVIAHEFTHRLINENGGVEYQGQSGAINESLADTMAAAFDTEDWIIGEDVIENGVRDMSVETTMDDFLVTTEDHGGVHTNSAIPNYAAYLIGEDVGRDNLGRIYARTIDEYLSPDMEFRDLAVGTWRAAVDLYGRDSAEARAVQQAWDGVLLLDGDTSMYPTQNLTGSGGNASDGGGAGGGGGGGVGGR
jgi:hypothetical protein